MRKYIYSILIFTCVCVSCSEKQKYNNCATFDDKAISVSQKIDLQGTVMIFDEEVQHPARIHCVDSVLLLTNINSSLFLDKYNLNTLKKMGSCIPFGSGPNEMLIVSKIQQIDRFVWLFDQSQRKLLEYSLPEFYLTETPVPSRTISLKEPSPYGTIILPTGKIIATTFNLERKRFSFFDMSGDLIENKAEYPDYNEELTEYEEIESFFCEMALSTEMKKIVLSYKQTDLIEIYDFEGNLEKRIQGPEQFFPALKQKGSEDKIRVSPKKGVSRDAYFYPIIHNNEIWVSYSGKYFDPHQSHAYLNKCIFVFDLKGNLVRQYNLDTPIFTFTIDKQKNKIYGITDNPEMQIIEFDIN